jgi:Kdo2-lipid IVA lauroyltransferase/acyltransferase
MLIPILRLVARLPLRWVHALGGVLGWVAYLSSKVYAQRLRENLLQSRVWSSPEEYEALLKQCIAETGRGALEMIPVWFRPPQKVALLIKRFTGLEEIVALHKARKGVILLTPHLGCFEAGASHLARHVPLTVLYKKPKMLWLERLIAAGRAQGQERLAPADLRGVRALIRALRNGEAAGILPDQAPGAGEGVWAEFFGRPAYTMSLVGRLIEATGAVVYIAFCRRLPRGEGYEVELTRVEEDLRGEAGILAMNQVIERTVRRCPAQYLWSYNRYKHPAGAPLPPG